jgi:Asp-tRNA(Asn)/Glu-tRNA(Gln) amidotransferase C subunit
VRPENLGFHGENADQINQVWEWVVALDAYDFNCVEPLTELVRNKPIPDDLKPAIANIIAGRRKPNLKAAAKLKVPADERMQIAGTLSAVLGLIDMLQHEKIYDGGYGLAARVERRAIDIRADAAGYDPVNVVRDLEADRRDTVAMAARELDVSTETIENLLRDLRKKIKDYPNV